MNRLTCVVPFFKGSSTIARAVNSLLESPVCDEIILVSDASPEPIGSSLQSHHRDCERSGRLKVVEMAANLGQAAARNIGAALATSPFISFLDQDDEVLSEFHVQALLALEADPRLAAVEVGASIEFDGMPLIGESDPRYKLILDSVPWNVVVRRTAFWACGGFPIGAIFRTEAAGEDIAFKSALKACFKVEWLRMIGVRHHVRQGSATDRFLRRTSIGKDRSVLFHEQYSVESDGSLSNALGQHVGTALHSRSALEYLFESHR